MKVSSGLLMFRGERDRVEVFLAHPGGPFFARKDLGHWTIPKGLVEKNEDDLTAAIREFEEETGMKPKGPYYKLGEVKQNSGKIVRAWAFEGGWPDGQKPTCNFCPVEWPPRSGKRIEIPEVDDARFFPFKEACQKMVAGQRPFLERLRNVLKSRKL